MNAWHIYAEQCKCAPKDQSVSFSCWLEVQQSSLKRRRIGGATERLLLGGVTTKPAATGDRPYLMPRLCPSAPRPPPPPGAGAGMPSETWGQDSFLSSHAPLEAEHLVPKEGRGSCRRGGRWDDPPSHSSSGCQPLIPGSHFFPLYALPASPLPPPTHPPFPCCSAVWLSAVRLRNGRRDRGLLPGEMVKRGLGPSHTNA